MMPPMMTVPPSCTTMVVSASRVENDGELVLPNDWRLDGAHLLSDLEVHQALRVHLRQHGEDLADVAVLHVFAVVGATALVCRTVEVEVRIGIDSPDQDVRLAVVGGDDVRRGQHLYAGDVVERVEEDGEVLRVA